MIIQFPPTISDNEWIAQNPDRWFRIRRTLPGRSGWSTVTFADDLKPATVINVCESRRVWGMQNILVVGEIVDTDVAAKAALDYWNQVLFEKLSVAARERRQ